MPTKKNPSTGRATSLSTLKEQAAALGVPKSTHADRVRRLRHADQQAGMAAMLKQATDLLAQLTGLDDASPVKLTGLPPASKPAKQKAARPEKPIAGGTLAEPETRIRRATGRRFILTSAQNNTLVHGPFWASLQVMARHLGAQILVSKFTYNKNAWSNGANITTESNGVWYADELAGHLTNESIRIADDLVFAAELDRLPTAADPLSGLDSYTRESSGIVGHPKVALRSLPVLKGCPPRMLYSTGAVTQRNYVDRIAGQKAAFHHVFGALLIEIDDDGLWFARQLIAGEDGSFQDLTTVYSSGGMRQARVAGLVYGDLHAEKLDDWMADALWGNGGIRDTLRPEVQVLHDIGDFTARNHHNIADPYFLLNRRVAKAETVEGDMARVAAIVARAEYDEGLTVVADANHQQQAMMTWLSKADIRLDPANKRYFHQLSLRLCEELEAGNDNFSIYEWAVRHKQRLRNTVFLATDQSFKVQGIEISLHGHLGPNGAKGSPKGYRVLGCRAITGHTHSAGIVDGVWTAGVSGRLDMGYNKGPSSWSHSHVVVYENGKRSMITMRGARWHAAPIKPRIRVAAAGRTAA